MSDNQRGDLIPLFCFEGINTSDLNRFLIEAYSNVTDNNQDHYAFRAIDSTDPSVLEKPTKLDATGFKTPLGEPASPYPGVPSEGWYEMLSVQTFQWFPNQPRLVRNVNITLDSQSARDGRTCRLGAPTVQGWMSVRVEARLALSASIWVHESQSAAQAIQTLINGAVQDGGVLANLPGTRSSRPLSDEIKALDQRKESKPSNDQMWIGCTLPVFLTAEIPLKVLNDFIAELRKWQFFKDQKVVFVDSFSATELEKDGTNEPISSLPESPFLDTSAEDINKFVMNNFRGHRLLYNEYIILDSITAVDRRTCILIENSYVNFGLLRTSWPSVFTIEANLETSNIPYSHYVNEAAEGSGISEDDDFENNPPSGLTVTTVD